jgi:CMP-N,N'-diacetyllegionaminic acid synthase
MKNIAIIPARSGSKGLKDKNIRLLNGQPLIKYSIDAAISANIFDEVMVSTDSNIYAEIAKNCGASVPFLRSKVNSTDKASSWDVVLEVLNYYQQYDRNFDTFCLLQPTSPLRKAEDILSAYNIFNKKQAKAVVSVCKVEHSPLWCNVLGENNSLDNFLSADRMKQRQELKQYYRINGAIYIANIKKFLENNNLYMKDCYAYIMNQKRSVDIDTIDDFDYAEYLLQK